MTTKGQATTTAAATTNRNNNSNGNNSNNGNSNGNGNDEMMGLHCATHDEAVSRCGRDDDSWKWHLGLATLALLFLGGCER